MRGRAYYSPNTDPPPGGLCLSAFAILRKDDGALVVKPRPHEAWKDWAPNWDLYDRDALARQFELWRLPCAYLREGEGPDDTARRIVRDQLGCAQATLQGPRVLSFHDPSSRFPGQQHWDLCFVYEAEGKPAPLRELPWLAEARWAKASELAADDFGSSIGDLARGLGLAR